MGKENTLDGFEGFQQTETTAENFDWSFDDKPATTLTTAEIVEEVLKDNDLSDEEKEAAKAEKAEADLMDEVFGDFGPEAVEVETEDEDEDETIQTNVTPAVNTSKIATLNFLKEKGLVEYELEEGQELTEELAEELAEEGWEKALENEVELAIKDLPDSVKALVKVAVKGGDTNDFLKTMYNQSLVGINKDTDMSVEENQVLALQIDLADQDYDAEYIETHIQGLKDSGKLAAMAEKVSDRIIKKQEDETAAKVKAVEDSKKNRKEGIKKQITEMSEHLATVENIKGIVINKKDKEILPTYIATPSVELQDGRMITQLQADLFKVMADKNKLPLLAKILQSDFDFSSVSNATITAYSKNIRENVTNAAQGKANDKVKSSGSSQKAKKSLADLLD